MLLWNNFCFKYFLKRKMSFREPENVPKGTEETIQPRMEPRYHKSVKSYAPVNRLRRTSVCKRFTGQRCQKQPLFLWRTQDWAKREFVLCCSFNTGLNQFHEISGALVVQWLRIRMPMQRRGFDPLSGKIARAMEQLISSRA